MEFYLQQVKNGGVLGVWSFDGSAASRIDITNPPVIHPLSGESLSDALKRSGFDPNEFERLRLQPGEYHPRIARPFHRYPTSPPDWSPSARTEAGVVANNCSQLAALTTQLTRICQTIHPEPNTMSSYGHDIRNLLLLACTEVEAHWRGILVANGANSAHRFTTNDYVKLRAPLRLGDYGVTLAYYPWLPELKPFANWDNVNPTTSLIWYAAYNAVKHDREKRFEEATLGAAIDSVAACAIIMIAQFGNQFLRSRVELSALFHPTSFPDWQTNEVYIDPGSPDGWKAVDISL